eukprot:8620710-Alexandrium_andersonii.AAC.1
MVCAGLARRCRFGFSTFGRFESLDLGRCPLLGAGGFGVQAVCGLGAAQCAGSEGEWWVGCFASLSQSWQLVI